MPIVELYWGAPDRHFRAFALIYELIAASFLLLAASFFLSWLAAIYPPHEQLASDRFMDRWQEGEAVHPSIAWQREAWLKTLAPELAWAKAIRSIDGRRAKPHIHLGVGVEALRLTPFFKNNINKYIVHHSLESGSCIHQPKKNPHIHEITPCSCQTCL